MLPCCQPSAPSPSPNSSIPVTWLPPLQWLGRDSAPAVLSQQHHAAPEDGMLQAVRRHQQHTCSKSCAWPDQPEAQQAPMPPESLPVGCQDSRCAGRQPGRQPGKRRGSQGSGAPRQRLLPGLPHPPAPTPGTGAPCRMTARPSLPPSSRRRIRRSPRACMVASRPPTTTSATPGSQWLRLPSSSSTSSARCGQGGPAGEAAAVTGAAITWDSSSGRCNERTKSAAMPANMRMSTATAPCTLHRTA